MTYGGFLLRHPLFWPLLSGLATGVALAAATSRPSRSRRPARASSRKWTITALALSIAVAAVAAGMIVVPDLAIIRLESAWAFLAGLVIFGLGFRFPRSAGLPVLMLVGSAAILGGWMVRGYIPVRDRTELGEFTVLSVRDDELAVEVLLSTSAVEVPEIVTVAGERLRAEVDQLDLPEALFVLGARRFVHYGGLSGAASDSRGAGAPRTPVLDRALELPSVRLARVSATSPAINLLRTYRLIVDPDARPELLVR
ncbi:MAG: hypothetical protein ACOC2Q_03910 [Spirochaetota bacterium]